MDPWEEWWRIAQGSLIGAQILEVEGESRSSASRAYYASYQGVTALLLYARQIPPEGREAWGHDMTPELLEGLPNRILLPTKRYELAKRVSQLYQLRLDADYHGGETLDKTILRDAVRSAAFTLKALRPLFPGA